MLAAVIRRGETYLICQRPAHKRHGGLWEFPGGKVEPGESVAQAAIREMGEELGVEVTSVGDVVYAVSDAGSPFVIEFAHIEIRGEPAALEHQALRWARLDEMDELQLAPSDRLFVNWLAATSLDLAE